jgi:hypothetical protein
VAHELYNVEPFTLVPVNYETSAVINAADTTRKAIIINWKAIVESALEYQRKMKVPL